MTTEVGSIAMPFISLASPQANPNPATSASAPHCNSTGARRPKREKHLHVPALPGTHASGEGFRRHNKLEKRNGR